MDNELLLTEAFPKTKGLQEAAANVVVQRVIDGDMSPFEAIVKVKAILEACKKVLNNKDLVDAVINESGRYANGEKMTYAGATIQVKESGTKYDYTMCGDDEWNSLNAQMEELKAQMKEREDYLQHLPEAGVPVDKVIDSETGEILSEGHRIYRAAKSSTTSFSINFPK